MSFNAVTATIATFAVAMGGWMNPSQDKTFTTYGYVDSLEAPASARVGQSIVIKASGALPQAGLTFRGLEIVEQASSKTILVKAVATGEKDRAYADMLAPFTATASYVPKVAGAYRFTVQLPNGSTEPLDKNLEVRP